MEVGIRELKAKLSAYVRRASAGERIVVTDRGKPVARLTPLATPTGVERGIEEGWIEPRTRVGLGPVDRARSDRSVLDALEEDRG